MRATYYKLLGVKKMEKDEKGRFKIGKFWFAVLVVVGSMIGSLVAICLIVGLLWVIGALY